MDLSKLGLNNLLRSVDSPLEKLKQITGFEFDSENERGVITSAFIQEASIGTAQISTFNFNQGTGGTLTLGGTTNGNGILSVNNQSGSQVVKVDNTGLTITNGSVVIQNSSGSNIIDSSGVVSANNFSVGTTNRLTINGTGQGFSTITYLNGGSLSIVSDRTVRVLFMVNGLATMLTGGEYGYIYMYLDTTYLTTVGRVWDQQSAITGFYISDIYAGTTNYRLAMHANNNIECGFVGLQGGYIVLGK